MWDLLWVFLISLGSCLLLTPMVRKLAHLIGLLDHPDGRRKIHAKTTPVAGGLAILAASIISLLLSLLLSDFTRQNITNDWAFLVSLLVASVAICLLGVLDDYGKLRGRYKLVGQTLIVLFVVAMGVRVDQFRIFGFNLELSWLAVPFTAFWLLGAINSLNLLDGLDGLLSVIAIIITLGFALVAGLNNAWTAAIVAWVLTGALMGFLRYNYPPASIFLGDSGSMLIGLTIGVLAIKSSLKGSAMIGLGAPLAIMTIPIMDTLAAIVRRKLTGRSIYTTDRGHLHHCMLSRGLTNKHILACVAALCGLTVIGGLASTYLKTEILALLAGFVVFLILVSTKLFGYVELNLIKTSLAHRTQRLFFHKSKDVPQELHLYLQGKAEWSELWRRLTARAEEMAFVRIKLDVNAPAMHEAYHARWDRPWKMSEQNNLWEMAIPIAIQGNIVGRLELAGVRDLDMFWEKLAKVAALVEEFETGIFTCLQTPTPSNQPKPKTSSELAIGLK